MSHGRSHGGIRVTMLCLAHISLKSIHSQSKDELRDDVDALAIRSFGNDLAQLLGSSLDGPRRRHARGDHLDTPVGKRSGDSSPVLDSWKFRANEMELVEAKQPMSEDYWVLR